MHSATATRNSWNSNGGSEGNDLQSTGAARTEPRRPRLHRPSEALQPRSHNRDDRDLFLSQAGPIPALGGWRAVRGLGRGGGGPGLYPRPSKSYGVQAQDAGQYLGPAPSHDELLGRCWKLPVTAHGLPSRHDQQDADHSPPVGGKAGAAGGRRMIIAAMFLGGSLALLSLAGVLYLAGKARTDVGQGRSVIPRVDIRC